MIGATASQKVAARHLNDTGTEMKCLSTHHSPHITYRKTLVSAPSASNSKFADVIPPAASLADAKNNILILIDMAAALCFMRAIHSCSLPPQPGPRLVKRP